MRLLRAATAAVMAGAAFGAPASATTAQDPVTAIQHQLVKGHGVKIVSRGQWDEGGRGWINHLTQHDIVGFSDGKVAGTETSYTVDGLHVREICVNGHMYERRGKKKRWTGITWRCMKFLGLPLVNLANARILKAILSSTTQTRPDEVYDGTPTTLYQGTITQGQLAAIDPALFGKDAAKCADWVVLWRLWIGKDQLVRRIWTSSDVCGMDTKEGDKRFHALDDIRLTDWGMKVTIKPPPASQTKMLTHPK
ncbi:hypothetical protein ACIBHX_04740 [Nonomuraea sp. NPDC050536]|uniref:hypothetical protein n=1 Tax=Nonomuraea sp. NPDC050536 TaxID=3364366 RepID=UPI0037C67450